MSNTQKHWLWQAAACIVLAIWWARLSYDTPAGLWPIKAVVGAGMAYWAFLIWRGLR